jgi:methyl-galactoside transport system permease protein
LLGVFLLQLVNAGLVFLNFEPAVMTVIKGAIILIACALDMRKHIAKT